MMVFILLNLFFHLSLEADPTSSWTNVEAIVDKHEFYSNDEVIRRPANSWQLLFSILYMRADAKKNKDCFFYKVPGDGAGIIKIKTVLTNQNCLDFLYDESPKTWPNIKALQYSIQDDFITISLTNSKYQLEKWELLLPRIFKKVTPQKYLSSVEYKSKKVLYLPVFQGDQKKIDSTRTGLPDKFLCHSIGDDCKEKMPSKCHLCQNGWYEIPGGCEKNTKYCGPLTCGASHAPACPRGFKYNQSAPPQRCQENSSFAYCSKGLTIQCQGNLAFCL